jgi:peptidoglycan/xylan/chitin deacetylase (PgdA/CDA1 family)
MEPIHKVETWAEHTAGPNMFALWTDTNGGFMKKREIIAMFLGMSVLMFAGCQGNSDDNDGQQQGSSETAITEIRLGTFVPDKIPAPVTAAEWDAAAGFNNAAAARIGTVTVALDSELSGSLTVEASGGAAVAYAAGVLPEKPASAFSNTPPAGFANGSVLYIRVTSEDGANTVYYIVQFKTLSAVSTLSSVTVGGAAAVLGTPGAAWDAAGLQSGMVTLPAGSMTNPAIVVVKSSQKASFKLAKTKGAQVPSFSSIASFPFANGDFLYIEVTAENGITKSIYKIAIIVQEVSLTPREKILKDIDDNWQELGYASKPTKYIALSFDDGPKSDITPTLLAALETKKVKATFFLIGQNIRANQTQARAIFNAGHELANHSDGYDSLGSAAAATIRPSLTAASTAISEITGKEVVLFRAPNVNYGANLTAVCAELNLAIIGVSLWSNDWQEATTTQQIISNVTGNPQDADIINCHELAKTVAAVSDMVDGLRAKGFWIMTVGDLAIIKEKTLTAGTQYDHLR